MSYCLELDTAGMARDHLHMAADILAMPFVYGWI